MICIVLDIQSNPCLCNTKCNGNYDTIFIPIVVVEECSGGCKGILHKEEECNVTEGTEEVTSCAEFPSTTYNFKYLRLNLAFEGSVKLVPNVAKIEVGIRSCIKFCKEHTTCTNHQQRNKIYITYSAT